MRHWNIGSAVLIGAACLLLFAGASAVWAQDVTRQELVNFDRFLDSHPAIAKDLQSNPSLVKDSNYLTAHQELKTFLAAHPGVREEIQENPKQFMNRERGFERSGKDITRTELKNFDDFLDKHPAIEKDLQTNPSLANDATYLSAHSDLKTFLASHPGVRDEIQENPKQFMNRERGFEKSGKDIAPAELKNFDDFLDKHPAMDKELEKNPSLVNNADYLAKHPELKQFLADHPQIREDVREHPRAFMRRERKLDKKESKLDKRQQKEIEADRREDLREERRIERQESLSRAGKRFK